jgi:AraC-like DNA-binding protein
MKLQFEKVPLNEKSFLLKEEWLPAFAIPWHNHPEFELTLLAKGTGKKFIGNHISEFTDGELVFIGPWLPHLWRSYETEIADKTEINAHQIVIQFAENFLGNDFFERPEMGHIKRLFQKAAMGMSIKGRTKDEISGMLHNLSQMNDFDKIMTILKSLDLMARSEEMELLSSPGFGESFNESDAERMNLVYKYIIENFRHEIYLDDVAKIAHLTPQAFSRYFKSRSKKTFTDVLNEVRIGHACKLILERNLSISQIADSCGFRNLSNFNRTFKLITQTTPVAYVKEYLSK